MKWVKRKGGGECKVLKNECLYNNATKEANKKKAVKRKRKERNEVK